jgi:CheY-like chemotaxis protein
MYEKKILVIDDEPAIHRLLQIILEGEGYRIVGVEEHKGTRQAIAGNRPDLIILDIVMPEVDGFDVLRMLKSDTATRDIPVIVLSVRNLREDIEKARSLGAELYMTKPFQPDHLVKAVNSISGSKSMTRCSG